MSALDEVMGAPDKRAKGCYACGAPPTAAVSVMVRRLKSGRPEGQSKSTQHNFCDEHAASHFLNAVALIEGRVP